MSELKATGTPGTSPVIRVRHLKENVAALDCFEQGVQDTIRRDLGDTVGLVERSASSAWLPIEVDVEIGEVVGKVCGTSSSTEVSAKAVDLHWHDVPAAFKASELSQVGFAGAFVAVLDVVKATGEATCALTADGVDFQIRWR